MSVELRTHVAVERAEAEREHVEQKVSAFETFAERVQEMATDDPATTTVGTPNATETGERALAVSPIATSAGTAGANAMDAGANATNAPESATGAGPSAKSRTASDGAEAVREAFRDTVLDSADADEMATALRDELTPELAAALAPVGSGLGANLRTRLVSKAEERSSECGLLADAIGTERDRLRDVAAELDAVTDWVAEADETPLRQLGFEALRERHDRLAEFRTTCDRLARERQAIVRGTRRDGLTGIRERELLDHLYADFEEDHPVLADLARLDDLLADCQRAVRSHLCARV